MPAGELEAGEELAAVCAAAYTVCARSPGTGDPGVDGGVAWTVLEVGTEPLPRQAHRTQCSEALGSLLSLCSFIRASPPAPDSPLRALHSSR